MIKYLILRFGRPSIMLFALMSGVIYYLLVRLPYPADADLTPLPLILKGGLIFYPICEVDFKRTPFCDFDAVWSEFESAIIEPEKHARYIAWYLRLLFSVPVFTAAFMWGPLLIIVEIRDYLKHKHQIN
ncbi:hypothetical protein MOO44_03785 [Nicoliella spurrieriana]|uniref:Uncharacterized protein n=2 Tax=Nicoliella spurrieriana TaxID=2925830 RepID=A0A976RSY7_9LACO|nr:hypothetical protein MOO44_03785 [Nicoliella spurrieriana]